LVGPYFVRTSRERSFVNKAAYVGYLVGLKTALERPEESGSGH